MSFNKAISYTKFTAQLVCEWITVYYHHLIQTNVKIFNFKIKKLIKDETNNHAI